MVSQRGRGEGEGGHDKWYHRAVAPELLPAFLACRYLRSRVGPKHSTVTYGSHVALHLSLGLLFLGGGELTLSTRPEAVAAMICAFYPKFPTHSNDNRSVFCTL